LSKSGSRLAVSIKCSHHPEFDDVVMKPQPCRINWPKVTIQEREDYYHESKKLLDQLQPITHRGYAMSQLLLYR